MDGLTVNNVQDGAVPLPRPSAAEDGAEQPLRVALVVPPYFDVPPKAYGGVESVVADLADALVARGHRVTLFGVGENETSARFVPVWSEPIPERLGEPFPEVVHAALCRRAVERLVAEEGLDVVHDHTFAGPLNAPAYGALGLPTVVTMHGPVDDDLRQYYSTLGSDIDLVAISERQRQLAPDLPWAGMVHNAVRVETFPYQPDKGDYAVFLGRFHPDKAPHLALEAAHAAGLRLVLAGKCAEPQEEEYFDREVRPRLTDRDTVFGQADADEKRRLLARARCLLFPIQWEEPFGMVMIEAMACGTPVVAMRGGAVAEIVEDGVTGYICDDLSELPAALHRLDQIDPAVCRRTVAERFNIDALGAGYEAVYRAVLAARRSGTAAAATGRVRPSDALDVLKTEYGDLDAALGQQYNREQGLVRSGETLPQPPAAGGPAAAPGEPNAA
ncbi:MAG TPA: glycosyltransferase family 4 protein [Micromonosporaceae bacterium]|nr:glycosyltransferase family 4 protein [Micromonosporaceae bacterium]